MKLGLSLGILLLAGSLLAQNPNTAQYPANTAADTDLFVATNNAQTTLNGNVLSGDTSIVLTSGTKFVAPVAITVDQEVIHCTTLTTNTLSGCTRGTEGTTAATHTSGATVYGYLTQWHHNQMAAEVKAIESNAVGPLVIANASSTGTTVNKLTKLTGAPSTAVVAATTDTGGMVGITTSGAGTTGNAVIAREGSVSCVFDGATTAGDYVGISSTTGGDCHDSGSTYPTSGQVIGRVLSTNGSGGTYSIDLFPSEVKASSGGSYTGFGSEYPLTDPTGVSFSWRNQGGATVSTDTRSIYLLAPASASLSFRGREITVPATPWSITIAVVPELQNTNVAQVGLYVTDGTKLAVLGLQFNSSSASFVSVIAATYTSATGAFNSSYCSATLASLPTPFYLKILDDATNLTFSWSINGSQFEQCAQKLLTDYLSTLTNVGFFANSDNSLPTAVWLLSWLQGTS